MFGVCNIPLKQINTLIWQGCIKMIKSNSEDIYVSVILYKICFELSIYRKNPKKCIMVFTEIY